MSLGGWLSQIPVPDLRMWQKVFSLTIDHGCFHWLCCWARCFMLQDQSNKDASCVFYVRVSSYTHLEQSQTSLLSVTELWIHMLTVHCDLNIGDSSMDYPANPLRQTSADIHSMDLCPNYAWQSCDSSCRTARFIIVNKQPTTDRHIAILWAVGTLCNPLLFESEFIRSITHMLAANYSILTWCVMLRTTHFLSLSYSSPIPNQLILNRHPPQLYPSGSKSRRMACARSNTLLIGTHQERGY